MQVRVDLFLDALPILAKGMLGVFAVTAVIVLTVTLLNRFLDRRE